MPNPSTEDAAIAAVKENLKKLADMVEQKALASETNYTHEVCQELRSIPPESRDATWYELWDTYGCE